MDKLTIIPDIEKTVIGGESEIIKSTIINYNGPNPLNFLGYPRSSGF